MNLCTYVMLLFEVTTPVALQPLINRRFFGITAPSKSLCCYSSVTRDSAVTVLAGNSLRRNCLRVISTVEQRRCCMILCTKYLLAPPFRTTCLSTSHLCHHSWFSDNDLKPVCFPVATKTLWLMSTLLPFILVARRNVSVTTWS